MTVADTKQLSQFLEAFLQPWFSAIADPEEAQTRVLNTLLQGYAKTQYGVQHGAAFIETINDYRHAFPIMTYDDYKPLIQCVMAGDMEMVLYEEPVAWAITRGTTRDESKFIPMTPTDIATRVSAGRAVINHAVSNNKYDVFDGINLNLNFPSVIGAVRAGDKELEYGYSSGIYLKHVSASTPIHSVPAQEEIDELGGTNALSDWHARFELAYEKCKDENVTLVGGVAQTAIAFGKYLRRVHGKYPKDMWNVQLMTLGSIAGINTRYAPALHAFYGPVVIREIYGATEGMFGQQKDEYRAWVPNYDLFFFEVQTRSGIKMLHEMKPGEIGSLVVSTSVFPRYKIGDLIRAFKSPYFRCIGRERWWTPLDYFWGEVMTLNLDRL